MPSNVELAPPIIKPILDDPCIDVHTQRPRTPNLSRRSEYVDHRFLAPPKVGIFFSKGSSIPEDVRFPRDHYSRTFSGNNLCGISPNLQYISDRWNRVPDRQYSGSRVGAYYPWPPNKAGEKVSKHVKEESNLQYFGIELERRPPTNLPGDVRMAFGRAAPGYYAHKYPNTETWTESGVMHGRDASFLYDLASRTWDEYDVCDLHQKNYLASLPETTEYQDKYLARLPSEKRKQFIRQAPTHKCPGVS